MAIYFYDHAKRQVIQPVYTNPLYESNPSVKELLIIQAPPPPPKGWCGKAHPNPLYVETSIEIICEKADAMFEKIEKTRLKQMK
jgi:hypothetical protein